MALKTTGTYKGHSNAVGGGGRFAQTVDAIKANGVGAGEAAAIAAKQGRSKFGAEKFAQMGAAGRKRAAKPPNPHLMKGEARDAFFAGPTPKKGKKS